MNKNERRKHSFRVLRYAFYLVWIFSNLWLWHWHFSHISHVNVLCANSFISFTLAPISNSNTQNQSNSTQYDLDQCQTVIWNFNLAWFIFWIASCPRLYNNSLIVDVSSDSDTCVTACTCHPHLSHLSDCNDAVIR